MPNTEVLPGTLQLILLKTLSRQESMHGFQILRWIREATEGELLLEEGALYPALHRMERRRWVRAEWRISEKGRRAKYYEITALGRAQLTREEREWLRHVRALEKITLATT
jgi:transcriptional regulator